MRRRGFAFDARRRDKALPMSQRRSTMKLDDPTFDSVTADSRNPPLLEALRDQIAFMCAVNPFWNERLARAAVDESRIAGLDDLARIPILTKEELRSLRPTVLLPQNIDRDIAIGRWTSGTSGRPTVNFWSTDDYAALVAVTARMLARQAPIKQPSGFNAYSQAHMTGPLYHAALSRLRGVVFDRSHHAEEIFPTSAQAELFDFDTLVAPSKAVRGKGIGLQPSSKRMRTSSHAMASDGGSARAGPSIPIQSHRHGARGLRQ